MESITSAVELVQDPMFFRVGFADTGIGKAAEQGTDILTDDLNLYLALSERDLPVINFNHLRSQFRL